MHDDVRRQIVYALRSGTVPREGLDLFATGLDKLVAQVREELDHVATGQSLSKWLRGAYGAGKTFTARYLCAEARRRGFATSEVQISVNDTPLHHLETVYRRLVERLETAAEPAGAFGAVVDGWLYDVGDQVLEIHGLDEDDPAFPDAVERRIEDQLAGLSRVNPAFAAVLRAVHRARVRDDRAAAQQLLGWLAGQPHTDASTLREAGVKGRVDGQAALTFLAGLLQLLRESGYRGLVVVLDEVETLQRLPGPTREKALNALRQLVDMLSEGRLPGLYLVVTGTPAFFEGPKGVRSLQPLHDRIRTTFSPDDRFDNLAAPQVRLRAFDADRLAAVGRAVRDLYPADERVRSTVSDDFVRALVDRLTDGFGGKVALVPRRFLRELVDVLDRVRQHEDFDPWVHYALDLSSDLTDEELEAVATAPPPADGEAAPRPRRRLDG